MSSITMSPLVGLSRSSHAAPSRAATRTSAPVRLTPRGRAVLLAVLSLPLAAFIAVGALNGGGATATMSDVASLEFVTVQPGATLWGLATDLAPGTDPRDVISDIMRFNQLRSADVAAGQQLAIPPKYLD